MKIVSIFSITISCLILIFIWIFTIINYQKLPEIIPTHFDFNGKPDDFGTRKTVWFLVVVATICFAVMLYFSKNPKSRFLNIPRNLKENPETGKFIVNILNVILMLIFADAIYESFSIALGKTKELSAVINYLLGSIFILIIGMMIYSAKNQALKNLK